MPKMSKEPSLHVIVFSLETVNIKKLTNLTANSENYAQITLNTKPHSDPLIPIYSCLRELSGKNAGAGTKMVQANIARFGADPSRVAIFSQNGE